MSIPKFAEWLQEELTKRRMSKRDLAIKAGLDPGIITRVINMQRMPGAGSLNAIAKALDYPPEFVFRQAGLLPPKKGTSDPDLDRFEARLALLTPENRERIYRLIELEYQLQLEQETKTQ